MRKLVLLSVALLCIIPLSVFGQSMEFSFTSSDTKLEISDRNISNFRISSSIGDLSFIDVNSLRGNFVKPIIEGYVNKGEFGSPELPVLSRLVEIPGNSEIIIEVINYTEEVISLNTKGNLAKIFPAQPSLSKSDDPSEVDFIYNEDVYSLNKFVSRPIVSSVKLGKMRGVNIGRIEISPFSYNPVTNELKVLNNIEVEIKFSNNTSSSFNSDKKRVYSPAFEKNLSKLINHEGFSTKELITVAPLKYVIISDRMFEVQLQPFISWKIKKGFDVIVGYTDDPAVGNTTTTIKNFLANEYNSATSEDPAPSYILFVGDVAQVPTFNGTAGSHVTDLYYCEYDGGGDIYPEVYYGRFSATNPEQLQPQIDKTLQYEQYLMPNPAFLDEVVLVAGVDASMAPTYGNGQINYGTDNYFNAAHGIFSHTYLYPASASSASQIIADVSNGVAFANYTAHCGPSGWSDPSFSTSDVPGLSNTDKYPLMIGNCCSSVEFQQPECFGEALLRASGKGALGYIGGSNSTYWNEDFWWGVGAGSISANPTYPGTGLAAYDRLFHENGELIADWFVTNGQIVQAGNLAVTEAGGAEAYYWEIYHLMGDPSISTYLSVPNQLACVHFAAIPVGTNSLTVTTEQYAYVAVSFDGVLLDASMADATGTALLEFDPLVMVGQLDIVATKQDRAPYISTVDVIVSNAPFVVHSQYEIDDSQGNSNNLPDYNELVLLNVTLENLGSVDALGVSAVLTTTDTLVTVVQNTASYGDIASSSTINMAGAFQLEIAGVFDDQHAVSLNMEVSDNNGDIWNSPITMIINSPVTSIEGVNFDDSQGGNGNGRFDAGEVIIISCNAVNSGHSVTEEASMLISSNSQYLEILSDSVFIGSLDIAGSENAEYVIIVDAYTPMFELVELNISLIAGDYPSNILISKEVGSFSEDWETETFTSFDWNTTIDVPWSITGNEVLEGDFSAESGSIGDNQVSTLSITIETSQADSISFYKKVSCEAPGAWGIYDYLEFSIDNVSQDQWGGEIPWGREAYSLSAGTHILTWIYSKDQSVANGADCAWIDMIMFPSIAGSGNNNPPEFTSSDITIATKDQLYTAIISTIDIDGDQVYINGAILPQWLSFTDNGDGTGVLSGTPGANDCYTHTIVLSANDGVAYAAHDFNIVVSPPVAINDISANTNFIIYPNPIVNTAVINYTVDSESLIHISIINSIGKEVMSLINNERLYPGDYSIDFDSKDLESGAYYIRFISNGKTQIQKVIITK